MNDALRDWVTNVRDTFYCIGTVAGPHPYPAMVRDFQSIIGKETREQMQEAEGRLPDTIIAAIGGGSNAMGLFYPFLDDTERAHHRRRGRRQGRGRPDGALRVADRRPPRRAAWQPDLPSAGRGRPDPRGFSISAGLDYPGIGPEHSWLHDIGRAEYVSITDTEALEAFQLCCEHGRHHSRPGTQPRAGPCDEDRAGPAPRSHHLHEHVRPGRQGHLHRCPGAGLGHVGRLIAFHSLYTFGLCRLALRLVRPVSLDPLR